MKKLLLILLLASPLMGQYENYFIGASYLLSNTNQISGFSILSNKIILSIGGNAFSRDDFNDNTYYGNVDRVLARVLGTHQIDTFDKVYLYSVDFVLPISSKLYPYIGINYTYITTYYQYYDKLHILGTDGKFWISSTKLKSIDYGIDLGVLVKLYEINNNAIGIQLGISFNNVNPRYYAGISWMISDS